MGKLKIEYGIDLGTTNSAIARMENGKPQIIKSELQKDIVPSCIYFRKQTETVGDKAYTQLSRDRQLTLKDNNFISNVYIEFKRTMGTDKQYLIAGINQNYSSEKLSAIVLQRLKALTNEETLNSVVITVPAKFTINQKDATVRAAKLAGFNQVELLQEPVAASFAYGLDSANKDGLWLVFDFGGGTFDAALLRVEEGIMKVFDTEGDNHLGGKNIDYAIIDDFLIPYFSENYSVNSFLTLDYKREIFRNAWKAKVEEAKIQLSFKDSSEILTEISEDFGEDDNGTPFELDLVLTEAELEPIQSPFFQRAIDITQELLKRNQLTGQDLKTVILVGGPTYSPILRRMIKEQISDKIDYSVDPMTVVARGAALYASTISVSEKILDESRDRTKIQLKIEHEPMSVEEEEFITVKILREKTDGIIPASVFIELARTDKAWTSERIPISPQGEMITVKLNLGKVNVFRVNLFDDKGNRLPCQPEETSIIQGTIVLPAPLSHNYGVEVIEKLDKRAVYSTIKGLEKNTTNSKGKGEYRTQNILRKDFSEDVIKIPFYEGDEDAEGSRAIYNEHVYDFVITGNDVPETIPSGSEIELEFIVKSEQISCAVYFPHIDSRLPLRTPTETVRTEVPLEYLEVEIERAFEELTELQNNFYANSIEVEKLILEVDQIADQIEKSGFDSDTKGGALDKLRKCFRQIDKLIDANEWNNLEAELLEYLAKLEKANEVSGNDQTTRQVNDFHSQAERIIEKQEVQLGKELLHNIKLFHFLLTWRELTQSALQRWNDNFDEIAWKDRATALNLINNGQVLIKQNSSFEDFRPLIIDLLSLLPESEKEKMDKSLLMK